VLAGDVGQEAIALDLIGVSLQVRPDDPLTLTSLAAALSGFGRPQEAVRPAQRAVEVAQAGSPVAGAAHHQLAQAYHLMGRNHLAYPSVKKSLEVDPGSLPVLLLGASVCHNVRRDEECVELSDRAIAVLKGSDLAMAHWNRALALLTMGRLPEGWREMEWRLQCDRLAHLRRPDLAAPQWEPGEDIRGKRVLLHAEGGLGDAIHFVRYVPMVLALGATVVLECQPALARLFQQIKGMEQLVVRGRPLPPFDRHCPLQGLPARFDTSLETIPAPIPYLATDAQLVKKWERRLRDAGVGRTGRMKVGLVWAGSVKGSRERSRSLEVFAPLAGVGGVDFVSLQVGPDATQAKAPPQGMRLADFTGSLTDFAQTAALIQNLDLVISVDTSVPHLAGAMGQKVWVMLPWVADFRWLLGRSDSPWYPTMRLFRQRSAGDWTGAVGEIAEALREMKDTPGDRR
jgi:hypothetical protein